MNVSCVEPVKKLVGEVDGERVNAWQSNATYVRVRRACTSASFRSDPDRMGYWDEMAWHGRALLFRQWSAGGNATQLGYTYS